jgi:uncharacterized membrane protein
MLRAAKGNVRDTDRLEAFSDGVLAIVITLLVLELHVPTPEEAETGRALWERLGTGWPGFVGYLISFAIIGILWVNHHDIFRHIGRTDQRLILLNLLLLLGISVIPFTTALLAEHLGHGGERTAGIVYAGWFLVTALAYNLLWRYAASGNRLIDPQADQAAVEAVSRRFRLGPPGYALALLLSLVWTPAGLAVLAALALLFLIPPVSGTRRPIG